MKTLALKIASWLVEKYLGDEWHLHRNPGRHPKTRAALNGAVTETLRKYGFMNTAKAYGLNPMKREIHFIKYGNGPAQTIVGYESYIKRAERTGKLDGWRVWIDDFGSPAERAIIEIKRKDFSSPFTWEVYRKEFDRNQANWKTMPTFMLKKVAIAQGFRLAFPDEIGGMPYIPEEIPIDKHGVSESASLATVEITPQEDNPHETKTYSLHPQELKDVQQSLGDEDPDPEELIKDKKTVLSMMMKGFSKQEKAAFYKYVMGGKQENVDNLQDFIERYMEYRDAYLKAQVA